MIVFSSCEAKFSVQCSQNITFRCLLGMETERTAKSNNIPISKSPWPCRVVSVHDKNLGRALQCEGNVPVPGLLKLGSLACVTPCSGLEFQHWGF